MKKILFGLAAVALAVSSCSENEEISSDLTSQKKISFTTYTNLTRGVDTQLNGDKGNLSPIYVTAIAVNGVPGETEDTKKIRETDNFFTNQKVTGAYESSEWKWSIVDATYFWPSYHLNFYAHNEPADGEGTLAYNTTDEKINKDKKTFTFTTCGDVDKMKDLVTATALYRKSDAEANTDASPVNLKFKHILSKVSVQARNDNPNVYTIKIKGIKFVNFIQKGQYTFGTFTEKEVTPATDPKSYEYYMKDYGWTPSTTLTDFIDYTANAKSDGSNIVTLTNGQTSDASPKKVYAKVDFNQTEDANWMFIPQTVDGWAGNTTVDDEENSKEAYIALLAKITTAAGGNVYPLSADGYAYIAVPIGDFKFEQGKQYTFKINFFDLTNGGGAGFVDPEDPVDIDGDGTTNPGAPIIKNSQHNKISFTCEVSDWDTTDDDQSIEL